MRFSIIVPAYAEEDYIENALRSIRSQTYRGYELIVVVRPSGDRTEEIARRYADKLILQHGNGLGSARNLGAAQAQGDILVFIDADTVIPEDFLEGLDSTFRSTSALAIVPRFCVYDGYSKGALVLLMLTLLARVVNKIKFLTYGMTIAIRSQALAQVGGFRNMFGEDVDLALRISRRYRINRNGRLVKYCNDLVAYTSSRRVRQLGFWRGLKLWIYNLMRRWLLHREFIGYLT